MEGSVSSEIRVRDELKLSDLWCTVYKGKLLILAVTIAFVFSAGLYILLAKDVYESSVFLNIGQVGNANLDSLIKPNNVLLYRMRMKAKENGSHISAVRDTGGESLVEIRSVGESPEEARDRAQSVALLFKNEHDAVYQETVKKRKAALQRWTEVRNELLSRLEQIENKKNRVKDDDLSEMILLFMKFQYSDSLATAHDFVDKLTVALGEERTFPTTIAEDASLPSSPIGQNRLNIMLMSVICGVLLGMLLAVVRNTFFIERGKKGRCGDVAGY